MGDCTTLWSVADYPLIDFQRDIDMTKNSKQIAGDLFTSFWKGA